MGNSRYWEFCLMQCSK